MKNTIRKIVMITLFIVGGVPSIIGFVSNRNQANYKLDQAAFAQTMGYYRLDTNCFYRCGMGMCTGGTQCTQSGSSCNVSISCG